MKNSKSVDDVMLGRGGGKARLGERCLLIGREVVFAEAQAVVVLLQLLLTLHELKDLSTQMKDEEGTTLLMRRIPVFTIQSEASQMVRASPALKVLSLVE
jgi:hypothetical protein